MATMGREALRNGRVLVAAGGCAFVWVALMTFDAHDWPSPAAWPPNNPTANAAGRAGAAAAYYLRYYLGQGSYALLAFASAAAAARLARRNVGDVSLRMIGAGLTVAAVSAGLALVSSAPRSGLVEGRGGLVGVGLAAVLGRYASPTAAGLIVVCSFVVGMLLTADDVLLRLPGALKRARRGAAAVPGLLRSPGAAARRLWGWRDGGLSTASAGAAGVDSVRSGAAAVPDRLVAGSLDATPGAEPASAVCAPAEAGRTGADSADESEKGGAGRAVRGEPIVRNLSPAGGRRAASPWPRELGDYALPPLNLLRDPEYTRAAAHEAMVREQARLLEKTLAEFRIDGRVAEIDSGPVITLFEVELAPGIKVGQISALSNDIARALRAPVVRVVPTLPGKNTIGIEVPNTDKEKVRLRELITLGGVRPTRMAVPVFIGKDASGNALIGDVAAMPHMLIAGTTGSGKSVCINSLIMSMLMTQRPDHVKLILIDPKMVELSAFRDVPHLMCPIVTEMQRAEMILDWAATKMDERYELLAEGGVKNIEGYNRLGREEIYARFQPTTEPERAQIPTHLPYIIILIDELADLMMTSGKEVEHHLCRLAQKSRAVGIHLIVATQRPQANVVTGLIKSNLPCRIAFRVASRMDSRIVLDQNGAELLMGQGDMLFLPPGSSKLIRAQGTYVEEDELKAVLDDLRSKASPEFHHELVRLRAAGEETCGERDELFDRAVEILLETQRGSVSLLQRRLEIGYSRASRLIDQMAAAGIVGEYKGSQAREILITRDEWEAIRRERDTERDAVSQTTAEESFDSAS